MKKFLTFLTAVFMVCTFAISASAYNSETLIYNEIELPNYESVVDVNLTPCLAIFSSDGDYFLIAAPNSASMYQVNEFMFHESTTSRVYLYKVSNDAWVKVNDFKSYSNYYNRLVWSNTDVIDYSGSIYMVGTAPEEPFFRMALWERMGLVTQGEMMGLTQTLVGTMKILVPCGVGLMALLVVLKLFGKRSLLFLR